MAKKKKKDTPQIVVGDGTKRVMKKRTEILDTSAPPIELDVTAKDEEEKTIEGVLNVSLDGVRNDMTFSFRANAEVIEHIKQVARELSVPAKEDVNYQKLMVSTFLDRYPMGETKHINI